METFYHGTTKLFKEKTNLGLVQILLRFTLRQHSMPTIRNVLNALTIMSTRWKFPI